MMAVLELALLPGLARQAIIIVELEAVSRQELARRATMMAATEPALQQALAHLAIMMAATALVSPVPALLVTTMAAMEPASQ
jgi:DNA-directed RNA polymerase specialized sigma24 family protein